MGRSFGRLTKRTKRRGSLGNGRISVNDYVTTYFSVASSSTLHRPSWLSVTLLNFVLKVISSNLLRGTYYSD
jgi:hypothetical protein